MTYAYRHKLIGTAALAFAIALPAMPALADAVQTRRPDSLAQGFGRAGGDAYWIEQKPANLPAPVVKAYNATKEFAADTYHEVKALATQPPAQQASQRSVPAAE